MFTSVGLKVSNLLLKIMQFILNPVLIRRQRISPEDQAHLYRLHAEMNAILLEAERLVRCHAEDRYKDIVDKVQATEYAMQERWKFPLDASLHSHWKRLPKEILIFIIENK